MQLSAEQIAATAIDANLIVNAGAGSGKTTVLTSRYIRLLEAGYKPEQIVAITYTKKAAREMRERIDGRLAKLEDGGEHWRQVRDSLISAPISTIHAFYARILREFPLEASTKPGFQVLDEMEADMLLAQALSQTIEEANAQGDSHISLLTDIRGAQALEEGGALGVQLSKTYKMLRNRGLNPTRAELSQLYGTLPPWQQSRDAYLQLMDTEPDVAAALAAKDTAEQARVRQAMVAAGQQLKKITEAGEMAKLFDWLHAITKLKTGRRKHHKQFVEQGLEHLHKMMSQALATKAGDAVLALLQRLDVWYSAIKANKGGLDYADLQFKMFSLLCDHAPIADLLRTRFKAFMIDEFQDTDRLQHKIITQLVGKEEGPGRLFVVGDEKQSIYRFRGADVQVFSQLRQDLRRVDPQSEKNITCNYRSRQPLIRLVNGFFTRLLSDGPIDYLPLLAHRKEEGACAELISCPPGQSAAEVEAELMASRIKDMVSNKEELVGTDRGNRPVSYGDIAILVRARTNVQQYQHQLRLAGIPYTMVGGIGFFQQQEVVDMMNLLRVVNNVQDQLALVAVLRSPLFALSDDSLLQLVQSAQQQECTLLEVDVLEGEERGRWHQARTVLTRLQASVGKLELPELLALAMDLTWFRKVTLTRFSGLQSYANLQKLVEMARDYAITGNDLSGFLTWLQHCSHHNEGEAQVDSEENDTVRIMTIHASKGLEFPVVFLPLASSRMPSRIKGMVVDDQGGVVLEAPWSCPVWQQAKDQEHDQEAQEFKRQLYVAITRARDRVVALIHPERKSKTGTSFDGWLQEFAAAYPEHFVLSRPQPGEEDIVLPNALPPAAAAQTEVEIESYFPLLTAVETSITPRYFSISQYMEWLQHPQQFAAQRLGQRISSEDQLPTTEEEGQQPGGAALGNLIHAALEQLTPQTDLKGLVDTLIPRFYPSVSGQQRQQIFSVAHGMLIAKQMDPGPPGTYHHRERELEFYYRLKDVLFYGLVDEVLVGEDQVAVVDYKSNLIPAQGVSSLLARYTPQLQFYALAVEEMYQRPVRAYLQFLRLPPGQQTVEVSLQGRHKLLPRLEEFVDAILGTT